MMIIIQDNDSMQCSKDWWKKICYGFKSQSNKILSDISKCQYFE